MATGAVYDESELSRVKSWVNMQKNEFTNTEKDQSLKEWVFVGGIALVAAIGIIFLVKKLK